ncbi:MAG TPA: helix-turn-helix domain-containing protein [archaeon]|nr:helix-turn-helix domain-containing protein [archaeon]
MDPDVDLLWGYFRHLFPEFSVTHALVYKLLWRVEPKTVEEIVGETCMSRATVYKMIHELGVYGLVKRTSFRPVGYFASSPVQDYSLHLKRVVAKLEAGKGKVVGLLENSSGLSGELYLVKRDGGQQRLLVKKNREAIHDTEKLLTLKRVVDQQLRDVEKEKLKNWEVAYR